ncbi:MAG: DUF4428 domain-containing protein [Bacillota bacterium]|nr:DUF4428 domain-containing protein [Bacillota bacterium]
MGLFSKKEKPHCPICGEEMGLFGSVPVEDGEICEKCEAMIRGEFDIEEYLKLRWGADGLHKGDYNLETSDPLREMTIEEIKEMIAEKKQQGQAIVEEMGGEFSNIARVEKCSLIAPKPLEVGLKRAKELKNRAVATCLVVSGELAKGDMLTVKMEGMDFQAKVLDIYECSSSTTFETVLAANSGKHKVSEGVSAWIILDTAEKLPEGTVIGY